MNKRVKDVFNSESRPNTLSLMAPSDEFSVPCHAFLSLRKGILGNREVPKSFRLADEDLEYSLAFVPATLGLCMRVYQA